MTKQEREEFKAEVERVYDEYLMATEGRGISWGELAYIDALSVAQARALLEECEEELSKGKSK